MTKMVRYPISLIRDAMLPELATGHAGGIGGSVGNAGEGSTAPNAGGSALETYLAELLGERLGRGAGADFVNGTGTGQPTGIATAATSGATTTDVGGVSNAALLALLASLDPAYIGEGAAWLMNSTTWNAVAALHDTNSRPLDLVKWPTGSGPWGQLYGIDVAIVPELASFGAGAGKSPILLGDIQRAYTVRIAGVPQVTTLVERYAEYLQRAAFAVTPFRRADHRRPRRPRTGHHVGWRPCPLRILTTSACPRTPVARRTVRGSVRLTRTWATSERMRRTNRTGSQALADAHLARNRRGSASRPASRWHGHREEGTHAAGGRLRVRASMGRFVRGKSRRLPRAAAASRHAARFADSASAGEAQSSPRVAFVCHVGCAD